MGLSTEEQAQLTNNLLKSQAAQIKERDSHRRQEAIAQAKADQEAKNEAIARGTTEVKYTRRQIPGYLEDIGKAPETSALGEKRTNFGDPTRGGK